MYTKVKKTPSKLSIKISTGDPGGQDGEKSKNNITWPKYLYFYTEEVLAQPYGSAAVAA